MWGLPSVAGERMPNHPRTAAGSDTGVTLGSRPSTRNTELAVAVPTSQWPAPAPALTSATSRTSSGQKSSSSTSGGRIEGPPSRSRTVDPGDAGRSVKSFTSASRIRASWARFEKGTSAPLDTHPTSKSGPASTAMRERPPVSSRTFTSAVSRRMRATGGPFASRARSTSRSARSALSVCFAGGKVVAASKSTGAVERSAQETAALSESGFTRVTSSGSVSVAKSFPSGPAVTRRCADVSVVTNPPRTRAWPGSTIGGSVGSR